jgi:hypothetical protein
MGGCAVPREEKQVVPFIDRQAEPARQRANHLRRGLRTCTTFEAGEVVGGHVSEVRDLLASQPDGPAARAAT